MVEQIDQLKKADTDIWSKEHLREIQLRHLKYFEFIDELLKFVPKFLPEGQIEIEAKKSGVLFATAILALFAKSVKSLRAVKTLCWQGLGSDANALLRTLLECLISLRFIKMGDRKKKATEYFAFCAIQERKLMNAMQNNPQLKHMISEPIRKVVMDVTEGIKTDMSEEEFENRYKASHWSGGQIETVAQKVGLKMYYDLAYRISSRAIHATDFSDHVKYHNGFKLYILPGDKWHREVLFTSVLFFLLILIEVNEAFYLRQDEALKSFKDHFEQLTQTLNL